VSRGPLTVYYDASCPMCAEEMHALRDAAGEGGLVLVDCSARDFDGTGCERQGVTRADMMSLLHAQDGEGRWLVALDAFEAVYRRAGFTRAANVWGTPWLRPVLTPLYRCIARHRQALSRVGVHRLLAGIWRG